MTSSSGRTRSRLLSLTFSALTLATCLRTTPSSAAELPKPLANALQRYIRAQHAAGLAPNWKAASIGQVTTLHGLVAEKAAYFEVQINRADGPAGYVVMSATPDDFPIVQWNDRGPTPSRQLLSTVRGGGTDSLKIHRVGIHYVAVDAAGAIRGSLPGLTRPSWPEDRGRETREKTRPEPPLSWAAFRDLVRPSVDKSHSERQEAIRVAWNALGSPTWPAPGPACAVAEYTASPNYRQLEPDEGPNQNWYYSGCGPTAWMMLLGWADRRADHGDANWGAHWQLFLKDGAPGPFAPDDAAAMSLRTEEQVVLMRLHDRFGTWGVPHNKAGSTEPWRMDRMGDYLGSVGIRRDVVSADTETSGGAQMDRYKESAARSICAGAPVVAGVGALEHYALATATSSADGHGLFYLNMGWGGAENGWYSDGMYFVGHLTPKKWNTLPPGALINAGSGQCLDVRGNTSEERTPVQQWGCTPSPNQRWQWLPTGEVVGIERTCLDVRDANTAPGAAVQIFECTGVQEQRWQVKSLRMGGAHGLCLRSQQALISAGGLDLGSARCDGPEADWTMRSSGQLMNRFGQCLQADGSRAVGVADCGNSAPAAGIQSWTVTSHGQIRSLNSAFDSSAPGTTGQCLAAFRGNIGAAIPPKIALRPCAEVPEQMWQLEGSLVGVGGQCMTIPGATGVMGTAATMQACDASAAQRWRLAPGR